MEKWEIARFQQFLVLPQCFKQSSAAEIVLMWERVKSIYVLISFVIKLIMKTKPVIQSCHDNRIIAATLFSKYRPFHDCVKRYIRISIVYPCIQRNAYPGQLMCDFNPFQHTDAFWRLCRRRLLKTLLQKNKLL